MSTHGEQILRSLRELNDRLAKGDEVRGTRAQYKDGQVVFEKDVVVIPKGRRFRLDDRAPDKDSSSIVLRILDHVLDMKPEAIAEFKSIYVDGNLNTPEDCKHPNKDQRIHTNHQNALQRDRGRCYRVVLDQLIALQKLLKAEVRKRRRAKCPCCEAHRQKEAKKKKR